MESLTMKEIYQYVKVMVDKKPDHKKYSFGYSFFLINKAHEENVIANGHNFDFTWGLHVNRELFQITSEDEEINKAKVLFSETIESMITDYKDINSIYVGSKKCTCCGKEIDLYFDGANFVAKEQCDSNLDFFNFDLAVPTGELLFGNDFRELFPEFRLTANHFSEIRKLVGDYASMGMFHPYVGNSCPAVVINEDNGDIEIGCFEGENTIDTRLWWVSVMDSKLFKEQCKIKGIRIKENIDELVTFKLKVKPGVYRCTYHNDREEILASMKFISADIPEQLLDIKTVTDEFTRNLANPKEDDNKKEKTIKMIESFRSFYKEKYPDDDFDLIKQKLIAEL